MIQWWIRASRLDKSIIWGTLIFAVFTFAGGPQALGTLVFGVQQANQTLQQR